MWEENTSDCARGGSGWIQQKFFHGNGGKALEWDRSPSLEMPKECLDLRTGHRLGSDPRRYFPPKQFPNSSFLPPFLRNSMCACALCPLRQLIPDSSETEPMLLELIQSSISKNCLVFCLLNVQPQPKKLRSLQPRETEVQMSSRFSRQFIPHFLWLELFMFPPLPWKRRLH